MIQDTEGKKQETLVNPLIVEHCVSETISNDPSQ